MKVWSQIAGLASGALLLLFGIVPEMRGAFSSAVREIVDIFGAGKPYVIHSSEILSPPIWSATAPDFSATASRIASRADGAARQGCLRLAEAGWRHDIRLNDEAASNLITLGMSRSQRLVEIALKALDTELQAQMTARGEATLTESGALSALRANDAYGNYELCALVAGALSLR